MTVTEEPMSAVIERLAQFVRRREDGSFVAPRDAHLFRLISAYREITESRPDHVYVADNLARLKAEVEARLASAAGDAPSAVEPAESGMFLALINARRWIAETTVLVRVLSPTAAKRGEMMLAEIDAAVGRLEEAREGGQ